MMERFSRKISEAASKQITYDDNDTQNLGEFDVRPNVYSRMIFMMYTHTQCQRNQVNARRRRKHDFAEGRTADHQRRGYS